MSTFKIIGVYPFEVSEPCHLVEVELSEPDSFDWDMVTQETVGQARQNWQNAWKETRLGNDSWVFFFHYLDLTKPLLTPLGTFDLPTPSPLPERLKDVTYESPC